MTVVWGVVGMLVGVIIAAQLAWPELNLGISFLSYGRLRPLHTNAVIFAFGGCGLFATSYYVVQRTCQVRIFSRRAGCIYFLGVAVGHSCWPQSRCPWDIPLVRSTPNSSGQSTC
jgi:cytochrome c oxidase cbb3-type subunit 1